MTHAEALEGGFIPEMDVDTQKTFTTSELLMYMQVLKRGLDQYTGIPVHTVHTYSSLYILCHQYI
jgi:hypothetical protein